MLKQKLMLEKVKIVVSKNKTLVQNFSYLSILQVFNLVLPLLTYPYLIRVLGKAVYGEVIFAQTIAVFFMIFIDFGFNITATKQISIHRDDKVKLSEIISSTLIIKIILGLVSFSILIILLYLVPVFNGNKLLYILSFGICLNEMFFSQWFFQGTEQMKYITIISVASRLVFVFFIFLLVNTKEDYLLIPLLNSISALLNGIVSLFIIFVLKKNLFNFPDIKIILLYFKEAVPLFWSRLISKVKDQSNIVFIGATIGMSEVAYYDLVSKLVNISISFIETISIAVFPKISQTKNVGLTRKIFRITLVLALISYVLFLIFGEYVVMILGGKEMLPAHYLFPLVGVFLLRSSSFFIGNVILIVNNRIKPYVNSLFISGASYFIGVGLAYVFKISFTIEFFIYVSIVSLLLEYGYRVYACKKYDLIDRIF